MCEFSLAAEVPERELVSSRAAPIRAAAGRSTPAARCVPVVAAPLPLVARVSVKCQLKLARQKFGVVGGGRPPRPIDRNGCARTLLFAPHLFKQTRRPELPTIARGRARRRPHAARPGRRSFSFLSFSLCSSVSR